MRLRGINFWPAFVDILIVLFLLTLATTFIYQNKIKNLPTEEDKIYLLNLKNNYLPAILKAIATPTCPASSIVSIQKATIKYRDKLPNPETIPLNFSWNPTCPPEEITPTPTPSERKLECGLANDFYERIKECIKNRGLQDIQIIGCSIRIPEKFLFEFGKSDISGDNYDRAKKLADCLIDNAINAARNENFDVVVIDGFADCIGKNDYNRRLASDRANAFLNLIIDNILADPKIRDEDKNNIMAMFATRSFGSTRQILGSECDCNSPNLCFEDRRIEININWKVDRSERNWQPVVNKILK